MHADARHKYSCLILLMAALLAGCGYPQAEPENLMQITKLRTALSARNEEWLRMNEEQIAQRHAANEMSQANFDAFQTIIGQARNGDWAGAERAVVDFQRAQRPPAR